VKVALFIPCYVDQFYPNVGLATLSVLEACGIHADFPSGQTCCGQPMANSGCMDEARPLAEHYINTFAGYDYVVAPSGSCVSMVRNHYEHLVAPDNQQAQEVRSRTMELSEFLVNVVGQKFRGSFPFQTGIHQSCHGLRELRLGSCSEAMVCRDNLLQGLLEQLDGIRFSELQRTDECCGFGGTFAVSEAAVSTMMGQDRVADHLQAGTQVLTAGDMSCLMHLDGIIRRKSLPIKVMHFAEILAEALQKNHAEQTVTEEIG